PPPPPPPPRYVKSVSFNQLRGEPAALSDLDSVCAPLTSVTVTSAAGGVSTQTLNPCGLVANSLFNDVISPATLTLADGTVVAADPVLNPGTLGWDETGIAWSSDVDDKFKQPAGYQSEVCACGTCAACDAAGWCTGGKENALSSVAEIQALYGANGAYQAPDGTCYAYTYPDDDTTHYLPR
ncbi:hypothetical protein TeGR_g13632, partial [Tetraparma gracilis]